MNKYSKFIGDSFKINRSRSNSIENSKNKEIENKKTQIEKENEISRLSNIISDYIKSSENNYTLEKNENLKLINSVIEDLKTESEKNYENVNSNIKNVMNINEKLIESVNSINSKFEEYNKIKALMSNESNNMNMNILRPIQNIKQTQEREDVCKTKTKTNLKFEKVISANEIELLCSEKNIGSNLLLNKELFKKGNQYYVGVGKSKVKIEEFKKIFS